ncbi:ATP-binding protein [Stenotrophomonas indicatrix]|uniref:ATP-binding protein n=1 Tax=Stenotrophomonas indicatrix TaxID=2045451 RepID=UPI00320B7352
MSTQSDSGSNVAEVVDATSSGNAKPVNIETVGDFTKKIHVEISTSFLEHFSEQLYSSPQKAFEELISNSWDAGADFVDVRISDDLDASDATMCVLDNGSSMDEEGLRALWHIAFSPKRSNPIHKGRPVIGKFGIGKLATYLLASKLTYVCKAADGKIRRVTMNYGDVERRTGDKDKLFSELDLDIFEVSEQGLRDALDGVHGGETILELIGSGVKAPDEGVEPSTEFGGAMTPLQKDDRATWTLVVLSGLKPVGRELKLHVLRRMLQSALPFGSEMAIQVNGERLISSKVSATVMKEWQIGPDLGITSIEIDASEDEGGSPVAADMSDGATTASPAEVKKEQIAITFGTSPYPHVVIPDIGVVTGTVRLFEEKISGGKSDERGASNGFHINVLGRVVNQNDPSFGEKNLSHAAWARFRMAVRADGLNKLLTTNREQLKERRETKIFRAFLRKAFNTVRSVYDSDGSVEMHDGGDVLVRSLGVVSLNPLRNVVSETLETTVPLAGLFDETGIPDRAAMRKAWRDSTAENIKHALARVNYERADDEQFVKFRIRDNTIVVNKEHPFVVEHTRSRAEKELVRTVAMVTLLTDMYALDAGVEPGLLSEIRAYRDKLLRVRALQRRQSGLHIAKLLLKTQHESSNSKWMEAAVSDALRYLGFQVTDMAKPGEPEGIGKAYPSPSGPEQSQDNPSPPLYSFAFDAKSSKYETAATNNIGLDGIAEHRQKFNVDYSLVVAPGYEKGAVSARCAQLKITPITGHDLGKLLEYTVEYGAISMLTLRKLFELYDPETTANWVANLGDELRQSRPFTIDIFISALKNLKGRIPDVLRAGQIAMVCRDELNVKIVREKDVITLVSGLQVLIPDLVGIVDDKIVINASADHVAQAIATQLEKLRDEDDSPAVN